MKNLKIAGLIIIILVGLGVGLYLGIKDKSSSEIKNIVINEEPIKEVSEDKSSNYITTTKTVEGIVVNKVYEKVFLGTEKIQTSNGEYSLEKYLSGNDIFLDGGMKVNYDVNEYAIIDLTGDGVEEIVFLLNFGGDSSYAFLHYEDGKVYGYSYVVYRAYLSAKTNGDYMASGGALYFNYEKAEFSKDKRNTVVLASSEASNDEIKYKVNNQVVSKEEFNKFEEEFNKEKNIEFLKR